jgi:hypothetical protein
VVSIDTHSVLEGVNIVPPGFNMDILHINKIQF